MPLTINLNTLFRVELTDAGKRWWYEHYEPSGALRLWPDARPPAEFTLWQLMHIFGPHVYNGAAEIPFVHNAVVLDLDAQPA